MCGGHIPQARTPPPPRPPAPGPHCVHPSVWPAGGHSTCPGGSGGARTRGPALHHYHHPQYSILTPDLPRHLSPPPPSSSPGLRPRHTSLLSPRPPLKGRAVRGLEIHLLQTPSHSQCDEPGVLRRSAPPPPVLQPPVPGVPATLLQPLSSPASPLSHLQL